MADGGAARGPGVALCIPRAIRTLPAVPKNTRSHARQLVNWMGEVVILVLAVAGISILVKYLGRAMILALPLLVLAAGLMLLAYVRWRKRRKARREAAARRDLRVG